MDTKYKVFWYSIAFYLLFGFTYLFKAQQYPIRLIPVMLPPYSLKLGEYATSTDNKLQLQVLMTDLQQPSHQVAIKFFLEGGTTNTPIASSAPFIQGV
ncbi:hypothetical protein BPO_p0026 (plasmid) [Bergeyella porcorum]|uniref:Uncharacterized protein n=1 Tax=Bergeyella porcorum TaxID=1735111 RepID=A0AAU0F2W7_9FLAO